MVAYSNESKLNEYYEFLCNRPVVGQSLDPGKAAGREFRTPRQTWSFGAGGAAPGMSRLAQAAKGLSASAPELPLRLARSPTCYVLARSNIGANATRAAVGMERLKGAMGGFPTGSNGLAQANKLLAENIKLQRQAAGIGGSTTRSAFGHRGHVANLAGLAAVYGGTNEAGRGIKDMYAQASGLQDAMWKMHAAGVSDADVARIVRKAGELKNKFKSTTILDNIGTLMEARTALAGVDPALDLSEEFMKARVLLNKMYGKEKGENEAYAMFKAAGNDSRHDFRPCSSAQVYSEHGWNSYYNQGAGRP